MSDVIWLVCEVCKKIIYETPCPHCTKLTETASYIQSFWTNGSYSIEWINVDHVKIINNIG